MLWVGVVPDGEKFGRVFGAKLGGRRASVLAGGRFDVWIL